MEQEVQQQGTGRQGQRQSEVATMLVEMALQVSLPGTALRDSQQVLLHHKFQRKLRVASLVETVEKCLASLALYWVL